MKLNRNQAGNSHLVVIVGVVVIAAIIVVGIKVSKNSVDSTSTAANSNTSTAVVEPDYINSLGDIKQADKALDNIGVAGSVDPTSFDQDIEALN